MPVVQPTSYRQKNYEAPKTSGSNNAVQEVSVTEAATEVNNSNNTAKIPAEYADVQNRRALESDLDKIVKHIFPDLGVRFKVHDSGNIITSVIDSKTEEVVREFPAEKILDIIHSMTQRIGQITNKRV